MLGLAELCSPSQPPATPSTFLKGILITSQQGRKDIFSLCVILQVEQFHLEIKVIDGDQRPLKLNQSYVVFFLSEVCKFASFWTKKRNSKRKQYIGLISLDIFEDVFHSPLCLLEFYCNGSCLFIFIFF